MLPETNEQGFLIRAADWNEQVAQVLADINDISLQYSLTIMLMSKIANQNK